MTKTTQYRLWIVLALLLASSRLLFAFSDPKLLNTNQRIKLIENKGQWDSQILFKANIPGGDVFITATGLVYNMVDEKTVHAVFHDGDQSKLISGHSYKTSFKNCNTHIRIQKGTPSSEYYNYFIGNETSKWAAQCRAYESVILQNMYEGIDVEIIAKSDYLKLNFLLKPNANPQNIKLVYEGQNALAIDDGALIVNTNVATIKEEKPVAFQQQQQVKCTYQLSNNEIGFSLGNYATNQSLTIDPNIIFGTFSGSTADNWGFTATYDNAGNGFSGGVVFNNGFPVTLGAYQMTFANVFVSGSLARDIGILKYSADGKQLLYATYLGGNGNEQPHSVICNQNGDLYLFGTTSSTNFPVTTTAFDKTFNGNYDMYVSCLSADGTLLKASTYWGGAADDGINGTLLNKYNATNPTTYNYGDSYRGSIILDASENVCIASVTHSKASDGYTIANGFQNTFGGGLQDGCVFKLTSNLSSVLFSSYIGGSDVDAAYSLVIDAYNNIFVCGGTRSATLGKLQGTLTYNGDVDAFVAKIGALGNSLQKLVYVGTSSYDQAYFIDIDSKNNPFIAGQTLGESLVKGTVYGNNKAKQFITGLNNNLDSITVSTIFGAANTTYPGLSPSAFMVDKCDRIYFSGWGGVTNNSFNNSTGNSRNLPITADAFQKTTDGSDFYLAVFAPNLAQLNYATFFGGNIAHEHVDGGTSRFDPSGVIYQSVCAGCGGFSDFPTTPGAHSNTNNSSNCNNALFKFSLNTSDRAPIVRDTFITLYASDSLAYVFNTVDLDGDSVSLVLTGPIFSITPNPIIAKKVTGKSNVLTSLNWRTLCSNASSDTIVIAVTAADNACPTPNTSHAVIKLLVLPTPIPAAPYPACLATINDSSVIMKWDPTLPSKYFKEYWIYRKKDSNPFQVYVTSPTQTDSQYIDTAAFNHLTDNYCYYIQTVNSCNVASTPSRTICSVFQNDSALALFTNIHDTLLSVIATDTLSYTFNTSSIYPQDSVYISVKGDLLNTNRVLKLTTNNKLQTASLSFDWLSVCDDLNDTFSLNVLIRDNACPQSRTKKLTIKIVVLPPPTDPAPSMKCIRSTGTNSTLVRWNKTTHGKYFSHYVLLRKSANGTWSQLATTNSDTAFSFADATADNNELNNICYTVYGVNVCGIIGDTAPFSCTVVKNIAPPSPIYIYTTTVQQNKNILLQWQKSSDIDFYQYQVFRKNGNTPEDYALYSRFENINDTFFIDEHAEVQKTSYCYELKQFNDCGIPNDIAYHACSILLEGKSEPFTHSLNWNDYHYFKNGIELYAINRQKSEDSLLIIGNTFYKSPVFVDNKLDIENGDYFYTVEAAEINSPFRSVSNTIELIQSPLLFAPNAFTANDDNLNDTWKPIPVFVKEFELKLYNRWGQLLFETHDKHKAFKDEFLNDPATSDVFVYVITYTGWDGSNHTAKGNVTLLK